MATWYIDRSRNISSILKSKYFEKLCNLSKEDRKKYETKELIDLLEISNEIKNPNALITFLRDIGLINSETNTPSNFLKVCVESNIAIENIILMIIIKKNSEKNDKSFIKPFIVLCKTFSILAIKNYELKIHWNDCVNYLMKCDDYDQVNEELIDEMLATRDISKIEESSVLDIWFNALCDTKLFEKNKEKFLILKKENIELITYFATAGIELACNDNREEGLKQMRDSTYGLYTMISNDPLSAIENMGEKNEFFKYYKNATKYIEEEKNIKNKKLEFRTNISKKEFKHNRIIFGAPGTGKSYTLNKEKDELLANNKNYERVTFHPDYSYANFVGSYKPVSIYNKELKKKEIEYKYVPGPFMRTLVKALKSGMSDKPEIQLLIVEEINRANVAAVFGDVFQLLDRKEGVSEYPIQTSEDMRQYLAEELNLNPEDCNEIKIPDNMYIWATMNSADQGVYPMDTAFKRRWDFTYIGINDAEEKIKDKTIELNGKEYKWNSIRKGINETLSNLKINEDKLLGPFFINMDKIGSNEEFDEIFKSKVLMYLFEDAGKQRRDKLFKENLKVYSSICNEYDSNKLNIFLSDILNIIEEYEKE